MKYFQIRIQDTLRDKSKSKHVHSLFKTLSFSVPHLPSIQTVENCMKLCPMIVQGFWEFKNSLLQLPYINEDNLKYFLSKKVRLSFYIT